MLALAGHTTLTCPHRVAMEHGVIPAPRRNTNTSLDYVFQSQVEGKIPMVRELMAPLPFSAALSVATLCITFFTLVPFTPKIKLLFMILGEAAVPGSQSVGVWQHKVSPETCDLLGVSSN
jgi:hypothetical protein